MQGQWSQADAEDLSSMTNKIMSVFIGNCMQPLHDMHIKQTHVIIINSDYHLFRLDYKISLSTLKNRINKVYCSI